MGLGGLVSGIFSTLIGEHAVSLLASLVLLCLSATYSGCETSLFSLTTPQLNRIRKSKKRVNQVIASLHHALKDLLPTILFCNMGVNILIYALSANIASSLGEKFGAGLTFLATLASLFLVIFFGEVFPKQFAISSSHTVAKITALPVYASYRLLKRPMRLLNAVVTASERVLDPGRTDASQVREEELKLLVEYSKTQNVISEEEYELIDGVVDLPEVHIRDIMVPRVDVASLTQGDTLAKAAAVARAARHCKLPVMARDLDDAVGWVDVRDIYSDGMADDVEAGPVDAYVRKFRFFSEHDRADQALARAKGGEQDLFAVVDERGWIIGFFTLQDIMDEVLGHFGEHGAPPPGMLEERDGGYVVSGRLAVREWRELFKVDEAEALPRSATVGGLITAKLGRIARPGDSVRFGNIVLTVLTTYRYRVAEVMLKLEAVEPAGEEKT